MSSPTSLRDEEEKAAPYLDGWHAHRLNYGPVEATNPYNKRTQAKSCELWKDGYQARVMATQCGFDTSSRDELW